MKTPKFIKKGDTIGYSAMSNGITSSKKILLLEESKNVLNEYKIIEDKYTRNSFKGESASALLRSKELNKFLKSEEVDLIISITGGNFLNEILDYSRFNSFMKNPKWVQGQSDSTILLYYLTTKYDTKTVYSFNANSLAKCTSKEIKDNLDILSGLKITQSDYNNAWICKEDINIEGRIIGGCLECLIDLLGTKYDFTKKFLNKYKEDRIIWYFDIDYMNNEVLRRNLWHLKNAGWFKYTDLIIFGRVEENSYEGISEIEAIEKALLGTDIKYITNFDLGHTFPRVTIVNGSRVVVKCDENNRTITILE